MKDSVRSSIDQGGLKRRRSGMVRNTVSEPVGSPLGG